MAEIRMRLLGVPEIYVDEQPIRLRRRSAVALLAYLVVTDRPQNRDVLAATLAGDTDELQAHKFLCNALSELRAVLGEYVVTDRHIISVDRQLAASIDVKALEAALAAAKTGDDLDAVREATELYRGEFLAGLALRDSPAFDEWLLLQREYFRTALVQALQATLDRQAQYGTAGAGLEIARRLLAIEPWREEAHRALMVILARSGQRSAALAQFAACRRILAEELGAEPSQPTLALFQRLNAGPTPIPHNLPAPDDALVGREQELSQLERWLADANCRLITLVGLGGSGKTRLAVEAARRAAAPDAALLDPPFPDGVFLAPADGSAPAPSDGDAGDTGKWIVAAIARAMGTTAASTAGPAVGAGDGGVAALAERLRRQRMLLVVDGVDQPAGAAKVLPALLSRAPGVKVIVTSRVRLHLQGEVVLPLSGVPVPAGADDLEATPAGTLLLQAARRVQPDTFVDGEARAAAAAVCRLVDGHPLGLLLAARCLPVMDFKELAAELSRSLDLLEAHDGDVPARQQSVNAVVDDACRRLDEPTREGLRRLVIFTGGFTRAAAREVAGVTTPQLLALVEAGLAVRTDSGRYVLGELVRRYAVTRVTMTPEEITRTAAQHARYCATFIAEHVPALAGDRPPLDAITAELPNLYAAWQWAADHQQSDLHEQMKPGLEAYYDLRNALAASIPATPSGAQDGPESTTGQCTSTVAAGVAADSASYWTSHPCMRRAHTRAKAVEPPLSTAVAVGADGAGGVAA